ncbi:MAG: hypothetical protein M1832_001102 [Thelocarpon impressellum]|nr:MAG: hypothetical protein M1832_001102 [Thelocarpon impressellum]
MATPYAKPRVFREGKLLQLSYELPHRVHTAKVYPVAAPNGATIIVYGHQNGIRILWRGGRPFKEVEEPPKEVKSRANGAGNDAIMIIDSDDDATPAKAEAAAGEEVRFEEHEEPPDPNAPFPPVLQFLDLPLHTDVLHLAFPKVTGHPSQASLYGTSSMIPQKLVMAVGCSDQTVRVITIPSTPPSPAMKKRGGSSRVEDTSGSGLGQWGEQVLVLGGHVTLQDIPDGVDVTLTPRDALITDEVDTEAEAGDEDRPMSRSRSRGRLSGSRNPADEQEWDLLVAAHSPEVSGMLLVFRVPIVSVNVGASTQYVLSADHTAPLQVQYLSSSASSISFNPSTFPSRRHSHLTVVDTEGVRVYECLPPATRGSRASSRRRSSFIEMPKPEGSWLISLYPGFDNAASKLGVGRRKRVLDAKWVLGGRGILVLLADGEWGIWDIEGAGPTEGGLGGEVGKRGLLGAAKTTWSLSGWVGEPQSKKGETTGFAPRTPHTRQREERKLFGGDEPLEASSHGRGGLSVRATRGSKADSSADEAVVLWHEGSIAATPSLRTYWETQLARSKNGGSLFSADGRDRLMKLEAVKLGGEPICGTDVFPPASWKAGSGVALPDVLVTAEHRLVVFSTQQEPPQTAAPQTSIAGDETSEQALVVSGDLELNGIERMLAEMDGKRGQASRKVGFNDL